MNFRKPIILSFLIHSAFFAAIAATTFFWKGMPGTGDLGQAGDGGAVTVWLAGPEHGQGGKILNSVVKHSRQVSLDAAKPAEKGGEGAGGGTKGGIGTGAGSGGSGDADPRLAKIWRKINSSKYYPQFAKRKGIEGTPRVTFVIEEDGSVETVKITASSGEKILDDAAREAVMRSAPLPYYPEPITLSVKYSLKE